MKTMQMFLAALCVSASSTCLVSADTITFPRAAVGNFGERSAGYSLVEGAYKWEVTSGIVWLGGPSVADWALDERVDGRPGEVTISRTDVVGGLFTFDSFMLAQRDPTPGEDIRFDGFFSSSLVGMDVFFSTSTHTLRTPVNLSSASIDKLVITLKSSGSNFAAVDDITVTSVPEPATLTLTLATLCAPIILRRYRTAVTSCAG
jgi:hypothetical protein